MSLADSNKGDQLKQYSYNTAGAQDYYMNYDHTFIERCYVLNPIVPTYFTLAGVWLVLLILWWVFTFIIHKQRSLYL